MFGYAILEVERTDDMPKIPVTSVEIERAEGLVEECITVTVNSLAEADAVLSRWAVTAPKRGYDKCDFKITFADGETYSGRYDLSFDRTKQDTATLAEHVSRHCSFYSGLYLKTGMPSDMDHMTLAEYTTFLNRHVSEADRASYAAFLETYDLTTYPAAVAVK